MPTPPPWTGQIGSQNVDTELRDSTETTVERDSNNRAEDAKLDINL